MKIVDFNQKSHDWLTWRSEGVTASDIPVLLGLSKEKTPWMLWAEKVGRINPPDLSQNPHVQRGIRLEDTIRQHAEHLYGDILLPVCAECDEWHILRASLDGLCSNNIPHEFKAPCESVWEEVNNNREQSETYKLYEAQVQAQCVVSGSKAGRLFFYAGEKLCLEFEVTLTDKRKSEILKAAKQFHEQVVTRTPPKADPERDWYIPDSQEDMFFWDAYSDAWQSANRKIVALTEQLEALKAEQKLIQEKLIYRMGPYMNADVGGVKVSRFEKKGAVDYKKYLEENYPDHDPSDLDKYRRDSQDAARFTSSKDELVNIEMGQLETVIKSAYF